MPEPKGNLVTPAGVTATGKLRSILVNDDGKPIIGLNHILKRSLWVPASAYEISSGAPSAGVIGHLYGQAPYWALDDSLLEAVGTSVRLPASMSANLAIYIYFCMDTAVAGVVRFLPTSTPIAAGESLTTLRAYTTRDATVPAVAQTLGITVAWSPDTAERAGVYQRHAVARYGNNAADTAAGDLFFLGALFTWDEDILADH